MKLGISLLMVACLLWIPANGRSAGIQMADENSKILEMEVPESAGSNGAKIDSSQYITDEVNDSMNNN